MLSKTISKNVVREIGNLVDKNINMMDVNGIIIASTDPSRIGQPHWGAKQVINNNLNELYISQNEVRNITTNGYVQVGLNLPLFVNGNLSGVIGITGEYEEVVQIGQIVKKMAEILLEDQNRKKKLAIDQRGFEMFLYDFLNNQSGNFSQSFQKQADFFDFKITQNYVIITFKEAVDQIIVAQEKRNEVTNITKHKINQILNKCVVVEKGHKWVILIPLDTSNQNNLDQVLKIFCENLYKELLNELNVAFYIGISSLKNNDTISPHDILEQANQALFISNINNIYMLEYDNIGLEMLLIYLPKPIKDNFLSDFFGELTQTEIDEYVNLFEKYFKHDGSISEIANEMFIHSNTVQYRLNKFTKINGKDIRKVNESFYFYIATLLEKEKLFLEKAQN